MKNNHNVKQKNWDISYNEAFFKTSHNSYSISVRKQLDSGVRGLEYDIHDEKVHELNDFEVYHLPNHEDVALGVNGNPNDLLFTSWLNLLKDWSDEHHNQHAPITLFIELKDNFIDENNEPSESYGLKKLNRIILDVLYPDHVYQHKDFRKNGFHWPSLNELKGKIIVVLTSYWGGFWASSEGGFESRKIYLKNSLAGTDDACFVAWIEEDKGEGVNFMKENTRFWKCSLEYSTEHYEESIIAQRLTRVDYDKIIRGRHIKTYYKQNYTSGYRANFPATDSWGEEKYDISFPWAI